MTSPVSGPTAGFSCKRFHIRQSAATWKVGTDSLLLGSWCSVRDSARVLDVGTGTGILALMVAQRCQTVLVDAVEIDPSTVIEAKQNVSSSPWPDRIALFCGDIMAGGAWTGAYDHVIANPPYFNHDIQAATTPRIRARHGSGFNLMQLPVVARLLLNENGILSTILPAMYAFDFIARANTAGLYVHKRMNVTHRQGGPATLTLLELGLTISEVTNQMLALYTGDAPSQEYSQLVRDFVQIGPGGKLHERKSGKYNALPAQD